MQKKITLMSFFSMVGGVSGLLTIATLVFYGGTLIERLKTLDARLVTIETQGSHLTQKHIEVDNQRDNDFMFRINAMEASITSLSSIRGDIREINAEIKNIKERLPYKANL